MHDAPMNVFTRHVLSFAQSKATQGGTFSTELNSAVTLYTPELNLRDKKGNFMKGQVSIEFLIIVGFAMLISIPLIYIFYIQSESVNSEITSAQVDKIASEVRDAADEVYYLGSPSKKTVTVYMPDSVKSITLIGTTIIFNVSTSQGRYEVVKWSVANFSSSSQIEAKSGIRHISVEAQAYDVLVTDD
jgi:uncharacterized protein (UPF0333 family)